MGGKILFGELTRDEARAQAPSSLIVLPIGATEQHGPHLPVTTDTITVEHIARRAAERASSEIPVLVAPTLPFGSSAHHLPFGGTMSVRTETYYRLLRDLLTSLVSGGARRLFLVNGHGGNHEIAQLAARDLALEHSAHAAAASYWIPAWDAYVAAGAHTRGRLPGHAGAFETSQVLALRPDLVRSPLPHREETPPAAPPPPTPPYRGELHGSWQRIDGFSDSPDRAAAEHGRRYLEAAIAAVAAAYVQFYRAAGAVEA
jgi:creatinine amidohydrolase